MEEEQNKIKPTNVQVHYLITFDDIWQMRVQPSQQRNYQEQLPVTRLHFDNASSNSMEISGTLILRVKPPK